MNVLSSEEMIKMQNEAKKRVLEMKEKSKFAVDDMNNITQAPENSRREKNPGTDINAIKMPVELPDDFAQNKINFNNERKKQQGSEKIPAAKMNIFGNLSKDELEKVLILSLCFLLKNENADEMLILALLYIIS